MNKILAFVFLGIGLLLLVSGFVSYENVTYALSLGFSEESTDAALWLAIGGLLASITGAFGLATEPSKDDAPEQNHLRCDEFSASRH